MKTQISYKAIEAAREAELTTAIKWHEVNGAFKTKRDRVAFEAGWRQAWMSARGFFKLHTSFETDY
jgi:hypothetical protein